MRGDAGETMITANDPKSNDHTFAITTPPGHGRAAVRDDGRVRVCADPRDVVGDDVVVVEVTDANDSTRTLQLHDPDRRSPMATRPRAATSNAFGRRLGRRLL